MNETPRRSSGIASPSSGTHRFELVHLAVHSGPQQNPMFTGLGTMVHLFTPLRLDARPGPPRSVMPKIARTCLAFSAACLPLFKNSCQIRANSCRALSLALPLSGGYPFPAPPRPLCEIAKLLKFFLKNFPICPATDKVCPPIGGEGTRCAPDKL